MRYSLTDFLACPACAGSLGLIILREAGAEAPRVSLRESNRVPPAGALVAPLPGLQARSEIGMALLQQAVSFAAPARNFEVEVEEGILACLECGRWFPVRGFIPELLPDHLRDFPADENWLSNSRPALPSELAAALRNAPTAHAADDGAHYKRSEIGIRSKVDDPSAFFGPGYSSPFNPHDTGHTLYLLKLFGSAIPLLELQKGDLLLDSGCGYAWTTEWFFKSGVEPIGVDICREYLDVGLRRIGSWRPHVVVGDIEFLPIRAGVLDAVFAYESFHHIPDRNRAMAGYTRALKPRGRIVLAEPGGAHEEAQVAVDVMAKYGILEKGMELEDVLAYAQGLPLKVQQINLLRMDASEVGTTLSPAWVRMNSALEGNLFRLEKMTSVATRLGAAARQPRRVLWPAMKRRIKRVLARAGLN